MKKFAVLLIAAACFLSVNAQASSIQETWFNSFFSELKKNLEPGVTAEKFSDGQHRIVFINMPIPYSSKQPFDTNAAKQAIIDAVKGTVDEDFLKKCDMVVVYNYITTDYQIHRVVITKNDF